MSAVMAGWALGYAMSIVTTGVLIFLLTRVSRSGWLDTIVAEEVPGALLAIPMSIGAMIGWTMVGMVLGSFYVVGGFESKANGLGSPSWQFALVMCALALLPLPPLVVFVRRYWWLWLSLSVLFAVMFGWLMPLLAER
ncbi:MAG: hypothetical protein LC118_08915 [Dehalococcoidia bacterium]|nr:hypothetical protein [Dehalococcoidia bacterium]